MELLLSPNSPPRCAPFFDCGIDLPGECIDHSSAESIGFNENGAYCNWAIARVGNADQKIVYVGLKFDVHASAFVRRPRMLNSVGDQFVHDESKRHRDVSGDDERIGIDEIVHLRSGLLDAAAISWQRSIRYRSSATVPT